MRDLQQPDFSAVFFKSFENTDLVQYKIRFEGPCALHDLAFLSSLLHDATFCIDAFCMTGKSISINISRDRWEKYSKKKSELQAVDSAILIEGVESLQWSTENPQVFRENYLQIDHLHLDDGWRGSCRTFHFFVAGVDWMLDVQLCRDKSSVLVRDRE